jgi:hypothetical protein
MRTKAKTERASASEKKKGQRSVFSVNVARMDRFLQENQKMFSERAKVLDGRLADQSPVQPRGDERSKTLEMRIDTRFVGALAGPVAKRRLTKG